MKRTIIILLLICMLLGCLTISTAAEDRITTGVCGDNLTWTKNLTNDTLTISGTGPMYDYSEENPAPWGELNGINWFVVENGVTSIGDYAFQEKGGGSLHLMVAETVTRIGHKVMKTGHRVTEFYGPAPEIAEDAFEGAYGVFYYMYGWEEEDLQGYGGTQDWVKKTPAFATGVKRIYELNEPIKPEELKFIAADSNGKNSAFYVPAYVQIADYDNSTLGEKSVKISVSGHELEYKYIVSDGQSHFDLVEIECIKPQIYTGYMIAYKPTVRAGSIPLIQGVHFLISHDDNINVGTKAKVKVTGRGEWEGLSKTAEFAILKRDISTLSAIGRDTSFTGLPVTPVVGFQVAPGISTSFTVVGENNVNMGVGTFYAVGTGNCYGVVSGTFNIVAGQSSVTLEGAYIGQADGELDTEQYYYSEQLVSPGTFTASINSMYEGQNRKHVAYYELYKIVGEEAQLIKTQETSYAHSASTKFTYDFSDVYEGAVEEGGEFYMLVYSWVNSENAVFTGMCLLGVSAKVPMATQMGITMLEETKSLRTVQMMAYGLDGALGEVSWSSSNPEIATVEHGCVTKHKPGSVTITAQSGDLTASAALVALPEDLSTGEIIRNTWVSDKFSVYYDGYLLVEGTDYVKEVSTLEDGKLVKITGIGALTGELVQQFDEKDMPVGHTHGYTSTCDTTCSRCDEVRTDADKHIYSEDLIKDSAGHWHECTACGERLDYEAHSLSAQDSTVCTVCGKLYMPGDLNGDFQVDNKDVEHLLWYTLFPESYAVNQDVDFDGSGTVDNKDVEHLLWHTLFPESYPL